MPGRSGPLGIRPPHRKVHRVPWNLPPNRGRNHAHRLRSPRPSGRRERVSVFLALRAGRRSQPAAGGLRRAGPGTRIEAGGREEAPRVLSSDPSRGRVEDHPAGTLDVGHPDGVICDRILPLNRGRYHTPRIVVAWQDYLYPALGPTRAAMALEAIPQAVWFFLPAFVANPMAVVFGGGTPIDFGRTLRDGERLFGDGKTWRGLVGGTFSGAFLGFFLSVPFNLGAPNSPWSFGPYGVAFAASAVLGFGALLGDLAGAFLKRRMHKPRGAKAPVLDQYDFVVGALLLSLTNPGWSVPRFFSGDALLGLVAIILITPALHRAVNVIGFRIGQKL